MPRTKKKQQVPEPTKPEKQFGGGYVPARWERGDQFPVLFVNQVFVHFEEGLFLITFGHGKLPFEVPYTKETYERLQKTGVPVIPVARIAVSPERLEAMLQVIGDFSKQQQKAKPAQSPVKERTSD